MHNETGSVRVT